MTPRLTIRNLSIRYAAAPAPALESVSLDVNPGERVALLGESGSGKSTLARAVAGLLPPGAATAGTVEWPELSRPPHPGRDFGFVFQDAGASFDPLMRIGAQVSEVIRAHHRPSRPEAAAQALSLLDRVGLPDPPRIARAYPHQLSGGQRQRAAIACAIAAAPKLLIADEPTSALDTVVQARIADLLLRLCREDGMSLLFVTHDIALAAQIAQRIAVLHAGRLVEWGETAAVITTPSSPHTRSLLAAHLPIGAPA